MSSDLLLLLILIAMLKIMLFECFANKNRPTLIYLKLTHSPTHTDKLTHLPTYLPARLPYLLGVYLTDCGPLSAPKRGRIYLVNGTTTFGSVARYSCQPGYRLSSPMTRVCNDTSTWSGFAPICVACKS